jgi:predicted transcriptional regulator
MNLHENIWYNVRVAANDEKKDVGISTRVSDTVDRRLKEIADEHDRKPAYVIRELLLRGLSLYEADGKLRGEAPIKAMRQLAPVVARIERGEMSKADVQRMIEQPEIAEIERRIKPRKTVKIPVGGKAR